MAELPGSHRKQLECGYAPKFFTAKSIVSAHIVNEILVDGTRHNLLDHDGQNTRDSTLFDGIYISATRRRTVRCEVETNGLLNSNLTYRSCSTAGAYN